jgi:hypothetical protein
LWDISYDEIIDWFRTRANSVSVYFLIETHGADQNIEKLTTPWLAVLLKDDGVGSYYIKANKLKFAKAGCLAEESIYLGLPLAAPGRSR